MTTWVLILLVFGGSPPASRTMTNVPGFSSEIECDKAGRAAREAFTGADPSAGRFVEYVCVSQTSPDKPGRWR